MTFKELVKQSWEDFKTLRLTFKNVFVLVVVTFILSHIITPLLGVPIGLLGSAYYLQNRKRKYE